MVSEFEGTQGIICPCTFDEQELLLVVDSASDVTCITPAAAEKLGLEVTLEPEELTPAGDGNTLKTVGYATVKELKVGTHTLKDVRVLVAHVEEACKPASGLIGLDLLPQVGISVEGVPTSFPRRNCYEDDFRGDPEDFFEKDWLDQHQAPKPLRDYLLKQVSSLLQKNTDIPSDTFCTHPSARVSLDTGEAKPVYVPQYRVSDYMSGFIDRQIEKWENGRVVCDAPADSPWNSPLLAALDRAARRAGKDPRICIDPRKINDLLASDPRPIPTVHEIHARLRGFKYITEIDLTKGFNQFPLAVQDRIKTTFTWKGKKRMFCGAPFGLKPLSQIFQGVIEQILHGVRDFATPFIDNIYVHTNTTMEDHADQVMKVLELLNENNLRINRSKCHFGYTSVNVLGHLLSGDSKRPDPAKISALHDWPVPKTGNDIERFLGFTNYLRDSIPLYSQIAFPMESLRKVKVLGDLWTAECQQSFEMFRDVLSHAPVLNTPLPDVEYCLDTDASQTGLGWTLYQIDPATKKRRYILFGAKALNSHQVNYGATRRELLAIVVALQACRHYIFGNHFTLYTDHKALTYLYTQKHVNYMMLNWIDTLFDYDFTVVHRPGILMVLPDALSRRFSHFRGGGNGTQRVLALSTSELAKYPDKELHDFINQRFSRKFVPATDRQPLLLRIHTEGHFGAETLFSAIWHQGYYWPGMRADCDKQVGSCLECLRFNVGKRGYHPQQSIEAELPFDHIAVDTITGFPTTERGNNVIVVITDLCTRFKLIYAQQTKSAAETASNLWKCMCTFPVPKILQSDNGTEYCNAIVKELTKLLGVDHRRIAAYNPRANGTAENAVGNTQLVLRKLANGVMTDWDLYLPAVQLALNSKPNNSTRTSPASLLFGMNVNAFANYDKSNSRLLTVHQLLERQKVMVDLVRPAAASTFKTAQKKRTQRANSKRQIVPPVAVGSLVMLKDPTRSSKHQPIWIGPFRVVKQKRGGTYVLQNVDSSLYHREPPRDQLKIIDSKAEPALDNIYFVERILDHKGTGAARRFLIKWLNFPSSDNCWEPIENLVGCESLLTDYWATRKALASKAK